MKNTILLLILFLNINGLHAQKKDVIHPHVNKNVELLCIVFQLAGNPEYQSFAYEAYNQKVVDHFKSHRDHPLIKFAKTLRSNSGISYDAVASMGAALDDQLNPIIDLSKTVPEKRWNEADARTFINLLKQFYKDADCKSFFKDNEDLFKEITTRFKPIVENIDFEWFEKFYGTRSKANFKLIVSLGCGNHNYGASFKQTNGEEDLFAILGSWKLDQSGKPHYPTKAYLPFIIHEYTHSFVNPLNENHSARFEESGKKIYKAVEYEMSVQQAYGHWQIMLNEALVRASVIKYFYDHGSDNSQLKTMIAQENNKGYIWMNDLVKELINYDKQRSIYSTIDSYITNLSKAYQIFATRISQFDALRPKVKSISEFQNKATNVNAQIKTITINFDKPLSGKGYSINIGRKGKIAFPEIKNLTYASNNQSIKIETQLQPNKEYQFLLTGKNFRSPEGLPLKIYEVNFRTAN